MVGELATGGLALWLADFVSHVWDERGPDTKMLPTNCGQHFFGCLAVIGLRALLRRELSTVGVPGRVRGSWGMLTRLYR